MQEIIEEEEMSEDEARRQIEHNKYMRFKRQQHKENWLKQFEQR